jgi:hypothetical protein
MTHGDSLLILGELQRVAEERCLRAADPALAERVQSVKRYQQRRFELTYADLLSSARYAAAARFFLEELYGPADFTQRDAQFERVVPALVRVFPAEIVRTVSTITRLHALSESLDTEMARQLVSSDITAGSYQLAWQRTGRREDRLLQIELTLKVGQALDHYTRNAVIRTTLRLMRAPAEAAGLASLQRFLEFGFDAFRKMRGASEFLANVATRERALLEALFSSDTATVPNLP